MGTDAGVGSDSIKSQIGNIELWCRKYTASILVLVIANTIFIYHVLKKKKRSSMVASYDILIQKKQYHKAFISVLSHPPTKRVQLRDPQSSARSEMTRISLLIERLREWQRSSILSNGKRLSGMPLLLYNSFILWNCRELELMMGSSNYVRFLWGIASVSILSEIWFTFCILSFLRDMNYGASSPLFVDSTLERDQTSRGIQRVKRTLVHRSMGSLTLLSAGILTVFHHRFPLVPISIVPFLNAQNLFFVTPAVGYAFCLGILSCLSHSAHPFAGVVCGTFSGVMWLSNLSSFMIENYWANGSFLLYLLLCVLSLKATESSSVPCIDHEPWDSDGRISDSREDNFVFSSSSRESSSNSDFYSSEERAEGLQGTLPLCDNTNDDRRHFLPNLGELNLDNQDDPVVGSEPFSRLTQPATVDPTINVDASIRSRRILRP